jgi:hypothetical protein
MDLALAWGVMAPFVACALAAWLTQGAAQAVAMSLAIIWGGAILAFAAGVRRGLGLLHPGAARWAQVGVVLWTFILAFGSMIALKPLTSLGLLILGYSSLALLAHLSVRRAEVPARFGKFRPVQMAVAALSLCAVAVRLLMRP